MRISHVSPVKSQVWTLPRTTRCPSLHCPSPASNAIATARVSALFEIALCSGIPSQFALAYMFALAGFTPHVGGQLSFGYITTLLARRRDDPDRPDFLAPAAPWRAARDVFLGRLPVGPEFKLGVGLTVRGLRPRRGRALCGTAALSRAAQREREPASAVDSNAHPGVHPGHRRHYQRRVARGDSARVHPPPLRAASRRRASGLVLYSLVFGFGHSLQGWDAVLATTHSRRVLGLSLPHAAKHHRARRQPFRLQRRRNIRVSGHRVALNHASSFSCSGISLWLEM